MGLTEAREVCFSLIIVGYKLKVPCFWFNRATYCSLLNFILTSHLFKVALHGFVCQQQDGPHQVSHQDEISFRLQVKGHNIVVVVTLGPQLLLSCPLIQTHLKQSKCVSARQSRYISKHRKVALVYLMNCPDILVPRCHHSGYDVPRWVWGWAAD